MDDDENELTGFGVVRRNLGRIQDGIDTYTGESADKPAEWKDDSNKVALRLAPSTKRIVITINDTLHSQYIYQKREDLENSVKQDNLRPLFSPMLIEE